MPEPALGVLPDPPEPAVPAEEPPTAATRPAAAALGPLPAAPAPAAPAGLALPPLLAAVPGVLVGSDVPARAVLPLLAAVPGVVEGAIVGRAGMPEPATGCAAVGRLPALPVAAGVMLWNPASACSLEQAASAAAARISAQRALRIDKSYSYRRCTPKREACSSCVTSVIRQAR
jgi:hypothetical protein